MAQKRMFSLQVADTDKFMDMSTSAQALYFHLGLHGDDDGFVASPKKIARAAGCNDDDLRLLAAKGYVIPFETGVIVITDWAINNTLKNDRYHETVYSEEKARLMVDKNGRYILGTNMEPPCFQNGTISEPEHNLTEHSLTKQNRENIPPAAASPSPDKPSRKKYGQYGWVRLSDSEYSRLQEELGQAELDRCIAYIDESAQSNGNKNKWKDWNVMIRKCHRGKWGLGAITGNSDSRDRVKTSADYDGGDSFI